ncbi:MAG: hypothetical protein IPM82_30210 [Saprospiraceae bacterium]|nr:hypothetical protein [Saprospiraceae bacterium]
MFGKEEFIEFRAFDLAFYRWLEAFKDKDKLPSQITNYSKEIISSVKLLFKTGRCTNFKRILVISENSITIDTKHVLEIIQKSEKETLYSSGKGVLETRILCVQPHEYNLDFKILNDFALFTGYDEEFAIVETSLTSLIFMLLNPNV